MYTKKCIPKMATEKSKLETKESLLIIWIIWYRSESGIWLLWLNGESSFEIKRRWKKRKKFCSFNLLLENLNNAFIQNFMQIGTKFHKILFNNP